MTTEYLSIGSDCFASNMLKMNGLKTCSYPFDWLSTNSTAIRQMLSDNFDKFLDNTYYELTDKFVGHNNIVRHRLYGNIFFHKNPLESKDYEYYVRCVERFKNVFGSSGKKVLIYSGNAEPLLKRHGTINDMCIEYTDIFNKMTVNHHMILLCKWSIDELSYDKFHPKIEVENYGTYTIINYYIPPSIHSGSLIYDVDYQALINKTFMNIITSL